MKVKIEDVEYEIDLKKAQELGLCKRVRKEVTKVDIGDVYLGPCVKAYVVILGVGTKFQDRSYFVTGFKGPLDAYSPPLKNYGDMIKYLNTELKEWEFIGNISDGVSNIITQFKNKHEKAD